MGPRRQELWILIMTAEILEVSPARGSHRVTFRFVDGLRIAGPFVEHRPSDEDHQAWANARIPQPPPDYYAAMQAALDGNVGPGTYDSVRRALKDLDAQAVSFGDVQMNVTYPEKTDPDDVEAALRERVDSELGEGKFLAVKGVLKAMGFESVTLERKSNLTL